MDAWMAAQHIRFGPAMRGDRHVRIQYWPDKHNQLTRHLARLTAAADPAVLEPERFAGVSVAIQGLPAMERLLFGDEGRLDGYACKYLTAIAGNLEGIAASLVEDWQAYPVGPETADGLVDSLMTQLQVIAELKLERVVEDRPGKARPRRAESWRSARSARNIRINLKAIADLYSGGQGADLRSAVAAVDEGAGTLEALDDAFAVAARMAGRLGDGLEPATGDGQERRIADFLVIHIHAMREQVAQTVAPALGVTLGFNALDGD
jgi:predicted lipoprotein